MPEQLTKKFLDEARKVIQDKLNEVGTELGLTIELGGISYTDTDFTIKIKARLEGALSQEGRDYEVYKILKGLPDLGTEFITDKGHTMIITGYRTRAKKRPVLLKEVSTDKVYAMDVKSVLRYCPESAE